MAAVVARGLNVSARACRPVASSSSPIGTWRRSPAWSTPAGTTGGCGRLVRGQRPWPAGRWKDGECPCEQRAVPWADLPADERTRSVNYLRSQLAQLEDVGFVPIVPPGGPAYAADFRRVGTVQARRLQARRPWTRLSGDELHGDAGDWRVVDASGDKRTVRDVEFRQSHEPLGATLAPHGHLPRVAG